MKVVSTQDWSWEQLSPYTRDITAAMKKLAAKFPDDVSVEHLGKEIVLGKRQLWLILDDDDKFVSFCLTQTHTVEATGKKVVTLTSHAGEEGLSCVPEMCRVIEGYAKEQGADMTAAEGRRGWARELKKRGYTEYATIFRKPIEAVE